MAYDTELADRVRFLIGTVPGVTEKKMFGGLAFLVGGNMAISASGQGGALVRVAPADTDALVAAVKATPAVMGGRTMQGWLRVSPEDLEPTSSSPNGSPGRSDTPGRFSPSTSAPPRRTFIPAPGSSTATASIQTLSGRLGSLRQPLPSTLLRRR